jgi:alginate O-acetyltransferase complex protein AlgI
MTDFFQALTFHPNHPLIFHSVMFFILFTVFYLVYTNVFQNVKARNIALLLFSLYFYYKVSGMAFLILLGIATSDFFIGKGIFRSKKRSQKTILLLLSLLIDLGCLVYFKYTNFFIQSWSDINGIHDPVMLNILMPLGISFFIFKSLTYIFDLYRVTMEEPEWNYPNYVLYVSFFPNVLSGPISKASDLLPQIREKLQLNSELISKGFFLIMSGAFKKIFIADFLAGNFVDRVFDAPAYFSGFESLMAGYGYAVQLYFDFSGYTDIAIGIACLLGFIIAPNFNKPFSAMNITDFWRRWHLTLSAWLRDYLFTPLSLQFRGWGNAGIMLAAFITFVICGFWHGPNLTYIIWGALHGVALAWDILTNKFRNRLKKKVNMGMYKFISIFITFNFLCFSFIMFRANSVDTAMTMYEKIFTQVDFGLASQWINLYIFPFLVLVLGLLLHYTPFKWNIMLERFFYKLHWVAKAIIVVLAFIIIYQVFSSQSQPFLYLEF